MSEQKLELKLKKPTRLPELPPALMEEFERICRKKGIKGKKKEELLEKLKQRFIERYAYEPGEAIGIVAAQSISEPATQMTMRSYTLASLVGSITKVVQGLPRLIEIFDLRQTFDKSMKIYLKPEYNDKEHAKKFAMEIKERKIGDVIFSSTLDLLNMQLEFEFRRRGDLEAAAEKLKRYGKVMKKGKKLILKPRQVDIKTLRTLKQRVLSMRIGGVEGIKRVIVVREGDDWVIQTTGSNLKEILSDPRVDVRRTTTDDIRQIYETLGIEAARNAILREAKRTLDEQGLDVDIRHLMLVADLMCVDGVPRPIGRYGVAGRKPSVLARANFEETKKHLRNAAIMGSVDRLRGVFENVMLNRVVPVGTGMVELKLDVEKLERLKRSSQAK